MHRFAAPAIGIPVRLSDAEGADSRVGEANQLFDFIVQLVRDAGGSPVLLHSSDDYNAQPLDGVVLPGGGDVNPQLYGQTPIRECYDVNPAQDELDLAIGRRALAAKVPLLGICRGHQLVNVLCGGTLIQDLLIQDLPRPAASAVNSVVHSMGPAVEGQETAWAFHEVSITPGSLVSRLYSGATSARIASGHHQAVANVGAGLLVTAVAPDGVVEGLEDPDRNVVTVQWHPESDELDAEDRLAPFRAFVLWCGELAR
ncbi:gamma-glutamyl-gamma-aminobutyrate hydrolase family protein [Pseudarthrobacter sp. J1738]|uniref:gamma-glutamyl-gamma-aminobutyrate hydrolase family protein n=1 Tax=unclassified Pseudarthrobacter TaxID=2647000 RepID=UPI003D291F39